MTLAEYLAEMGAPEPVDPRARDTQAPPGAAGVRDAVLSAVTTEGSPAEWLAQKVAPGFKSTNTAGIYAKEPDVGAMAMGMAGPMKTTETPAFKEWFRGSRVTRHVQRTGETVPLRVHHSTDAKFNTFDAGELGFHFGDKAAAKQIGGSRDVEAYLSLQNPMHMRDVGVWGDPDEVLNELAKRRHLFAPEEIEAIRQETSRLREKHAADLSDDAGYDDSKALAYKRAQYEVTRPIREALMAKNVDGIVYPNEAEGFGDSYIAFQPTQVKSVRNRGTFDPSDPNIMRALPPLVGAAGLAQFLRGKQEDE